MSPVKPSGGESLQEMIDRYNRELLQMGHMRQPGSPSPAPSSQASPPLLPRPRPEPDEPLHRPGSNMPRPLPDEPMDSPSAPHSFLPPAADQQNLRDIEQGLKDIAQGRKELKEGLQALRQGLLELERLQQDITHRYSPESERAEKTPREQGYGLPGHSHDRAENGQELPERDYGLSKATQRAFDASADIRPTGEPGPSPEPVAPTVPGRVPAQKPPISPSDDNYGTLIVQVYTARQAEPVAGAQVAVTLPSDEGELLFKLMTTNEDGRTSPLRLPVTAAGEGVPSYGAPFVDYQVYASAVGFQPSGPLSAQIFAGVTSILPVELIPGRQVTR